MPLNRNIQIRHLFVLPPAASKSYSLFGPSRGTQILAADRPGGPHRPDSAGPVTPRDRGCFDGTLHVGRDGLPWIVFCHE